jgi:membrane protein
MVAHVWKLLKEGFEAFGEDDALSRGAAIAFYAVTAMAPVLYILALIAGLAFGHEAASSALTAQLVRLVGPDGAKLVHSALHNAMGAGQGWWANIAGVAILILTASGLFGEIQTALNTIWRTQPEGSFLHRMLRGRAVSLLLVLALGLLLVASVLSTAAMAALGGRIAFYLPMGIGLASLLNFAVSFVLTALLFAAIYKILPDRPLEWHDVGIGAAGTALLFLAGQAAIGLYLGRSTVSSAYGAAGSLILLLLWIYYSAQIFLLGAEFTKVYACHHGSQQCHRDILHGSTVPQPQPAE